MSCSVCSSNVKEENLIHHVCSGKVRNRDCKRITCAPCLGRWLEGSNLDNKGWRMPECSSCKTMIPMHICKAGMSQEKFDQFERKVVRMTLRRMNDLLWCPGRNCDAVYVKPLPRKLRGGKNAPGMRSCQGHKCEVCEIELCIGCGEEWNEAHQKIPDCKVYAKWRETNDPEVVQLLQFIAFLGTESKKCPTCGKHVEKNRGCNSMQCTGCATYWCYRCEHLSSKCACSANRRREAARLAKRRAKRKQKRIRKKELRAAERERMAQENPEPEKEETDKPKGPSKETIRRRERRARAKQRYLEREKKRIESETQQSLDEVEEEDEDISEENYSSLTNSQDHEPIDAKSSSSPLSRFSSVITNAVSSIFG